MFYRAVFTPLSFPEKLLGKLYGLHTLKCTGRRWKMTNGASGLEAWLRTWMALTRKYLLDKKKHQNQLLVDTRWWEIRKSPVFRHLWGSPWNSEWKTIFRLGRQHFIPFAGWHGERGKATFKICLLPTLWPFKDSFQLCLGKHLRLLKWMQWLWFTSLVPKIKKYSWDIPWFL